MWTSNCLHALFIRIGNLDPKGNRFTGQQHILLSYFGTTESWSNQKLNLNLLFRSLVPNQVNSLAGGSHISYNNRYHLKTKPDDKIHLFIYSILPRPSSSAKAGLNRGLDRYKYEHYRLQGCRKCISKMKEKKRLTKILSLRCLINREQCYCSDIRGRVFHTFTPFTLKEL